MFSQGEPNVHLLRWQNMSLHPDTVSLLEQVENLTGKPVRLIEDNSLNITATIRLARESMPVHVIRFKLASPAILSHAIAHECVHAQRIFTAPPEKRLMTVIHKSNTDSAFKILGKDQNVLRLELDERGTREILGIWHQGMVMQAINIPVDFRIESWLYSNCQGFHAYQEISIGQQAADALAGYNKAIEVLTPRIVYEGSNAINYAYLSRIGSLLGKNMVARYDSSSILALGDKLASWLDTPDTGLIGDIETVNRWAQLLGIEKWFAWKPFEDIPPSYSHIS